MYAHADAQKFKLSVQSKTEIHNKKKSKSKIKYDIIGQCDFSNKTALFDLRIKIEKWLCLMRIFGLWEMRHEVSAENDF